MGLGAGVGKAARIQASTVRFKSLGESEEEGRPG